MFKNGNQPKVLLIGGCGYVGSYLYERLVEAEFKPIVCDKLTKSNPQSIPVVQKDYAELGAEELSAFDAVVWFAGHSSVQQAVADPNGALANNCLNLYSLAKKLKPTTKLIYASSGSLYSKIGTISSASRESDLVQIPVQNAYDISKFAFDYLAQNFLSNFYALRMGTVSGYSPNLRPELLFNAMSLSAATKGKVILKNREAHRTILFLDDLWLLVQELLTSQAEPGVYNSGSVSGTIGQFAEWIAETWSAEIIDEGVSETYSFLLDTTRMDLLSGKNKPECHIRQRSLDFIEQYRSNTKLGQ